MTLSEDLMRVLSEHDNALDELSNQNTNLRTEKDKNLAEIAELKTESLARDKFIEELQARIVELEKAPTVPPVTSRKTLFGACPSNPGGQSLAAAQSVVDKWGGRPAIRQFRSSIDVPNIPKDASITHNSYKPVVADVVSGKLDSQIKALAEATPEGHMIEIWHESDSKVRGGSLVFNQIVAAKNRFYDVVKATNPKALVVNTVTGWLFEPKAKLDFEQWSVVRADVLGVDLDGIISWPYPDFTDEIPKAADAARRWGYKGWCVPEFGMDIDATRDADGVVRTEWIKKYSKLCIDAGALYVAWFDWAMSAERTPGYILHTPTEVAAWKELVHGNTETAASLLKSLTS